MNNGPDPRTATVHRDVTKKPNHDMLAARVRSLYETAIAAEEALALAEVRARRMADGAAGTDAELKTKYGMNKGGV